MPESEGTENLQEIIQGLIRLMLLPADEVHLPVKLNRPFACRGPVLATPPDHGTLFVCYIHHFPIKDLLVQTAWDHGTYDYLDGSVRVLPDLSRPTLQRRAMLHPLLEMLRKAGVEYQWGCPFHLIVRKGNGTFFLRHPLDLPELFKFFNIPPLPVLNWLIPFPAYPRQMEKRN